MIKEIGAKQKGDIAEARIAELVVLYGEKALACYRPITDEEGIDLIVKEKGASLRTIFLQVKSRFNLTKKGKAFVAHVKTRSILDNYRMAVVFCYFDLSKGDLNDKIWLVPAPEFIQMANKLKSGLLGFVASPKPGLKNKWNKYLIDKQSLADELIKLMSKL